MGIGTSIFLIALGAILYFAVNADVSGLEISTVGLILMLVGALGLVISLFFLSSARRAPGRTHRRARPRAVLGRRTRTAVGATRGGKRVAPDAPDYRPAGWRTV